MAIARDKFWLFGVRPHQDDPYLGGTGLRRSRITPAEGAFMLDIPNVMLINCDGEPVPFSEDAFGYAESFLRMKKVLWGATGSAGFRVGNEEKFICTLAEKYPNICGAFMDDFLQKFRGQPDETEKAEALLREIRTGLDASGRDMEMYMVWYTYELNGIHPSLLKYIDGITLWTWNCEELPLLEGRFETIEKNFREKKKMLGIYMFDFPSRKAVPLDLMKLQCELGLRLMQEGRLDGMIFETNSVMGIGLESELWLRKWIDEKKNTVVPD